MSSSNSPCAACKFLRRKCTQECVFAPYFPPDQPQKFANVHKVFGASNVTKLLNELNATQREDAVNSLAYEAEFRLRDPVYGCVGLISVLQHKLKQMQTDLYNAKKELSTYIGSQAMLPILQPPIAGNHPSSSSSSASSAAALLPYNMFPMLGIPNSAAAPSSSHQMLIRDTPQQTQTQTQTQNQNQLFEAQQLAAAVAAREQQEMFRAYEQKQNQTQTQHHSQRQQELMRFDGFDPAGNQINSSGSNLTLGTFVDNSYQIEAQPLQVQLFLQPQQTLVEQHPQTQHKPEPTAEDGRNMNMGPSC
ncbi:LOB domain-containing protein 36, partial [Cucurbita argyrosperma subsp. argyrosperma]